MLVAVLHSGDRSRLLRSTLPSAATRDLQFFGIIFRWVRPILWSGKNAVGGYTLRTGGKNLTDIAERDDVSAGDILSKHVNIFAQNLISKLRVRGPKRTREAAVRSKKKGPRGPKPQTIKRAPREVIKRGIFS